MFHHKFLIAVCALAVFGNPGRSGTSEEIQKLVDQLGDKSADVQPKAAKELTDVGARALTPLRKAIFGKDADLAKRARAVLDGIYKKELKSFESKLAKLKPEGAIISLITDDPVAQIFPGEIFFSVRFRQYPVALRPPAGLKQHNLFIWDKDSQHHFTGTKELMNYFIENTSGAPAGAGAKQFARAWLRLTQEFDQDGFFHFTIPDDEIKTGAGADLLITARALVKPEMGNKGEILVVLSFDLTNKLEKI